MCTDRGHGQNISGQTTCTTGVVAVESQRTRMRHFGCLAFVCERDELIHGRLYFESFYATPLVRQAAFNPMGMTL
jgi:hypothetical protein